MLCFTDNKSELNRDCKHLVEFKITREDLLADSETISSTNEEEVTTTMSEPNDVCPHVAEPPPAKRSRNKATKAAKPRKSPNLSSNESDKAQAKIAAAKARANRMFRERSSTNATDVSHKNSGLCEETRSESVVQQLNSPSAFSSAELLKMLETQKKEIEELQDALKKYQSAEGQYH